MGERLRERVGVRALSGALLFVRRRHARRAAHRRARFRTSIGHAAVAARDHLAEAGLVAAAHPQHCRMQVLQMGGQPARSSCPLASRGARPSRRCWPPSAGPASCSAAGGAAGDQGRLPQVVACGDSSVSSGRADVRGGGRRAEHDGVVQTAALPLRALTPTLSRKRSPLISAGTKGQRYWEKRAGSSERNRLRRYEGCGPSSWALEEFGIAKIVDPRWRRRKW